MSASGKQSWFGLAILIGFLYAFIGVVFALPSHQIRVWRFAAWVISAAVYAAHIGYEHFRKRNSPGSTALHVAMAVGIGAFGIAVSALVHSFFVTPNYPRSRLLLALVLWPVITGVPAFMVAWVATAIMARLPGKRLAGIE